MKQILKNTTSLAVVKISGTNITETIQFDLDITANNQMQVIDPAVSVIFAQWNISSNTNDQIIVSRKTGDVSNVILNLGQNQGKLDFGGCGGFPDAEYKLSDIVVTIIGTGNAYLTIRKLSGFQDTNEPLDTDIIGYQPLSMGWIQVF